MAFPVNSKHPNGATDLEGLTLANVDLDDIELVAKVRERDLCVAGKRIQEAVTRMRALGVVDATGRRVSKDLPADMREESTTDFGG